ncbi:MAG: 4-(cytidine 5'-diphospho)-2-C-methyl-D-erythritol kinase [Paracoccaceae bacterium]|nr:4-(cytidine 5'-diphospho)-2-C-methyl-D-erythritol kinase [Paracoccaceae bacterium]
MTTVRVFAPAKINLTLHITGQREDGYHLIDSLVAFAPASDEITLMDGNARSLTVEGPEAEGVPADMENLALRAATVLVGEDEGVAIVLEKHLPSAAGIGGGSADAAAVLRGMLIRMPELQAKIWTPPTEDELKPFAEKILALGADVPMCLLSGPSRARGVGEKVELVELPPMPGVLVNPRVPVPTKAVFEGLKNRENPPMAKILPAFAAANDVIAWLKDQRNDLERPAIEGAPVISGVLDTLGGMDGCQLARMSGSGATCFGLFKDMESAQAAHARIRAAHSNWWVSSGWIGDQLARATPRIS